MKKYFLRIIAVLVFASAVLPSCSVEYRERHRHHDHDDHRDHDDRRDNDYHN
jgi:hypothetical protein